LAAEAAMNCSCSSLCCSKLELTLSVFTLFESASLFFMFFMFSPFQHCFFSLFSLVIIFTCGSFTSFSSAFTMKLWLLSYRLNWFNFLLLASLCSWWNSSTPHCLFEIFKFWAVYLHWFMAKAFRVLSF
jgi:hypothetical protein